MKMNRIIGTAIFAIGIALLVVAFRATDAPLEKLSDTMTGRYSDETMWYFAAGIAAAVGGGLVALFGSRN